MASALPNKEHPGRVRGEEGNVGWKKYLASTKCPDNTMSLKTIEELNIKMKHMEQEREIERQQNKIEIDRVRDEMRAELKARDEFLQKLMRQMNGTPNVDDQREKTMTVDSVQIPRQSSTTSTIQFENISPLGLRSRLYLDHPTRRLVAHGSVYGQGVLFHGKHLNGAQARVSVKRIISGEENSVVPYVTDELKMLVSSIDNYIAWPRNLIEVDESYEVFLVKRGLF